MLDLSKQTRLLDRILNDDKFDKFTLTAWGKSMRPLLKDGMEIQLRKIRPGRQLAVGDVAAVRYRNGLLVHRIVLVRGRKNDREYFTKGDWRLVGEGWVGENKIAGIMIREKRYLRAIDLVAAGFSFMLWGCGKLLRRK